MPVRLDVGGQAGLAQADPERRWSDDASIDALPSLDSAGGWKRLLTPVISLSYATADRRASADSRSR